MANPNELIVIGPVGMKQAYLNIPLHEALAQFCRCEGYSTEEVERYGWVRTFTFDDEFFVYDAGPLPE